MSSETTVKDHPAELAAVEGQVAAFLRDYESLRREVGRVIVGQHSILESTLIALLTGGHSLLEGVPGLGKTRLVKTVASALGLSFRRIQFTPDLMPADLTGTNVLAETKSGRRRFRFQAGPVFANIVLADEVNRATPKTQSALLEAMQEGSVTVGGVTHDLPRPFVVLATQNPLDMEGTYPLPEAQLDRFLFKLRIEYPSASEFDEILGRTTGTDSAEASPVLDAPRLLEMEHLVRQVPVSAEVRAAVIALVMMTHPEHPQSPEFTKKYVRYGASPRGGQSMILAAKARALLDRRLHVSRDDLKNVAHACLRHRIVLSFEAQADGVRSDEVIDKGLERLTSSNGSWRQALKITGGNSDETTVLPSSR